MDEPMSITMDMTMHAILISKQLGLQKIICSFPMRMSILVQFLEPQGSVEPVFCLITLSVSILIVFISKFSTNERNFMTASPPGPFVINFNSDKVYEGNHKPENGFRIKYEIL